MYELKTILPNFDIKLPTCMYRTKMLTLNGDCSQTPSMVNGSETATLPSKNVGELTDFIKNLSQQIDQIMKNSFEISSIYVRQHKVLQQLEELKIQLKKIRANFHLQEEKAAVISSPHTEEEETPDDIVVNANPKCIPYGLLAFIYVCDGLFDLNLQFHVHSSVGKIPEAVEEFQNLALGSIPSLSKEIEGYRRKINRTKNSKVPSIKVTVIWKECDHNELISSDTMYVPIYGEVNLLRYLARIGPKECRYEDLTNCDDIDVVLDICHQLNRRFNAKERTQYFKVLNQRLSKKKFFGGDYLSIADLAVISILRRLSPVKEIDTLKDLKNWYDTMAAIYRLFSQDNNCK